MLTMPDDWCKQPCPGCSRAAGAACCVLWGVIHHCACMCPLYVQMWGDCEVRLGRVWPLVCCRTLFAHNVDCPCYIVIVLCRYFAETSATLFTTILGQREGVDALGGPFRDYWLSDGTYGSFRIQVGVFAVRWYCFCSCLGVWRRLHRRLSRTCPSLPVCIHTWHTTNFQPPHTVVALIRPVHRIVPVHSIFFVGYQGGSIYFAVVGYQPPLRLTLEPVLCAGGCGRPGAHLLCAAQPPAANSQRRGGPNRRGTGAAAVQAVGQQQQRWRRELLHRTSCRCA